MVSRLTYLPLSYLNRIQFCYLSSGFILIARVPGCRIVCARAVLGRRRWHMYTVGIATISPHDCVHKTKHLGVHLCFDMNTYIDISCQTTRFYAQANTLLFSRSNVCYFVHVVLEKVHTGAMTSYSARTVTALVI